MLKKNQLTKSEWSIIIKQSIYWRTNISPQFFWICRSQIQDWRQVPLNSEEHKLLEISLMEATLERRRESTRERTNFSIFVLLLYLLSSFLTECSYYIEIQERERERMVWSLFEWGTFQVAFNPPQINKRASLKLIQRQNHPKIVMLTHLIIYWIQIYKMKNQLWKTKHKILREKKKKIHMNLSCTLIQ